MNNTPKSSPALDSDPLAGIEHCPVCGRELLEPAAESGQRGWLCKCGEFIPARLSLNSFQGCTHGVGCNCARQMRR